MLRRSPSAGAAPCTYENIDLDAAERNYRVSRVSGCWVLWHTISGQRPTRKELGLMSSRRPQGVSSHRGIHGKRPLDVWRRNGAIAHGG